MTHCPNSTESGCRCPDHAPGLTAYATDPDAYDQALERLRPPVRLRVITTGPGKVPCNGTMTCPCESCVGERIRKPAPGTTARQPWQPRPSRHQRAA